MTFKTDIKFDESPVLRSLEKVAVDRGLVTPDPMTKEASVSESYAPTDDLHEDMLKLVAGLRAKGFVREAEALEDKINTRKFAETHLYRVIDEDGDDLLDFAHPEGDVEVAPSASGLGKVWTEQSAKKEIERIVNKKPTGKYASVEKFAGFLDEELKGHVFSLVSDVVGKWQQALAKDKGWHNQQLPRSPRYAGILRVGPEKFSSVSQAANALYNNVSFLLKTAHKSIDPKTVFFKVKPHMLNNIAADLEKQLNQGRNPITEIYIDLLDYYNIAYKAVRSSIPSSSNDVEHKSIIKKWSGWLNKVVPPLVKYCIMNSCEGDLKKTVADFKNAKNLADSATKNRQYTLASARNIVSAINTKYIEADIITLNGYMEVQIERAIKFLNGKGIKIAVSRSGDISKRAEFGAGGKPVSPSSDSKPAPRSSQGVQSGNAMRQAPVTEEIQKTLIALSEFGRKAKWPGTVCTTLSLPKHGPDNEFGSETKEALKTAEIVRKQEKIQSPPIPMANNQAALGALKKMLATVNSTIRGTVYDEIKGHKVTSMDLMSPYSFYELITTRLQQKVDIDSESGIEMVSVVFFEWWIEQLFVRAKLSLNEGKSNEERGLAGQYIRSIKSLMAKWNKTLEYAAKEFTRRSGDTGGINYTADTVRNFGKIPVSFLQVGSGFSSRDGGDGGGNAMRQRGGGRGGNADGGDTYIELIDGPRGTVPSADAPPIHMKIDLSESWWDLPLTTVLDYNEIGNNGVEFADTYFSHKGGEPVFETPAAAVASTATPQELYEAALRAGYPKRTVKWNPSTRQLLVQVEGGGRVGDRNPWQGRWVPADENPWVLAKLPKAAPATTTGASSATDHALNFLRQFRKQISGVLQEWSSQVTGSKTRKKILPFVAKNARLWQRKLANFERQIIRFNEKARRV